MEIAFGSRLKHAWNAFLGNETFGFRLIFYVSFFISIFAIHNK